MSNEISEFFKKLVRTRILVGTGIRGITKIKLRLFSDEISYLEKIELARELKDAIKYIENIAKDARYVRFADFKGSLKPTIEDVKELKTAHGIAKLYSNLVLNSYQCYEKKVGKLGKMLPSIREPRAEDTFWLMFLCYVYNLMKAYNEGVLKNVLNIRSSEETYRKIVELVDSYSNDFITPYLYIRRKPHIILRGNDKNIVNLLKRIFDDEMKRNIYKVYWDFRQKLSYKEYPYDVSRPVLRETYREMFGKKWNSVILTMYPVSIEKFSSHISTIIGRERLKLRLHTTIYMELLVDAEGEEYMVFSNKNFRNLRENEQNAVEETLKEIVGIDYGELISKSEIYKADTASFVDEISESILEGPNATANVIVRLKQSILREVEDKVLTNRDAIIQFIKSMRLIGVTLRAIKKKRELAILKAEIEYGAPLGIEAAEEEVIDKAKHIFASFKEFRQYYEPLGADVKLSLEFRGEIDGKEANIIIDKEEVIYNNLPRDLVSELAYVIAEALKKGNSES